jgi:hypothetical protein
MSYNSLTRSLCYSVFKDRRGETYAHTPTTRRVRLAEKKVKTKRLAVKSFFGPHGELLFLSPSTLRVNLFFQTPEKRFGSRNPNSLGAS